MAVGDEVVQSLTSDAGTNTAGIQGRQVNSNAVEIYYSAIANKKPATRAAARRTTLSSADSTASLADSGYTGSLIDAGNSMMILVSCRFSVAGKSAAICLALYDESNNIVGRTGVVTIQGGSIYTDGTLYLSDPVIMDIGPAAKYFPILVTAPSSGTVSIFSEHL